MHNTLPHSQNNGDIHLRTMRMSDLDAILAIQSQCYCNELIESRSALASRHQLAPDCCWIAEHEGEVRGYLLAHPWQGQQPPQLDSPLSALPESCDLLFLHDMALSPAARGLGIAPRLMDKALHYARQRGFRHASLVAVQGADRYWQRLGFTPYPLHASKLARYGHGAQAMRCGIRQALPGMSAAVPG
ncbi:GNAT family N-acetyltransferase [Craterilacuibacter sp.]|uniref:GNAT family N-acetyltransferase n=1 Tax=Craterilacuibacter sp. TaxID=2870909 RepID=UPI003F326E6E